MEIIIALVVLGVAIWWFFLRTPADTTTPVVYKVETPPTPEVETKVEESKPTPGVIEAVVELAPAVVVATVTAEAVPAKKPRKPRAPRVVAAPVKAVVKKAAPKKAAAIKATPKAKSKKV
jgi:hypothetical protein